MATRTRIEWPTLSKTQQRSRRRRRKKIHVNMPPLALIALRIVFTLLSVLFLALGLVMESVLWYLVMALSAGAALASHRALQMQRDQAQEKRAHRGPQQQRPKAKPMPGTSKPAEPQQPVGQVKCTKTGQPTTQCNCATRHVATADGVETFGLPLGSPLGVKKKDKKPPKTVKN